MTPMRLSKNTRQMKHLNRMPTSKSDTVFREAVKTVETQPCLAGGISGC